MITSDYNEFEPSFKIHKSQSNDSKINNESLDAICNKICQSTTKFNKNNRMISITKCWTSALL